MTKELNSKLSELCHAHDSIAKFSKEFYANAHLSLRFCRKVNNDNSRNLLLSTFTYNRARARYLRNRAYDIANQIAGLCKAEA